MLARFAEISRELDSARSLHVVDGDPVATERALAEEQITVGAMLQADEGTGSKKAA